MAIKLEKAHLKDANSLFGMQYDAFLPLLEKYQDHDTSPANESIDKIAERLIRPDSTFFKIMEAGRLCGAIRIHWKAGNRFWVSPLFIHPDYQGRGIASKAMALAEKQFPEAVSWELATILEEEGNCRLYEKAGYVRTGAAYQLNEKATLGYFKKLLKDVER
ncbi:GNAT family N-acetyltransferase [Planomicrobium chinense]|uniref:GNAT family N-acetyltransferase n=1 Tax=Planococcus chinensis TaxID=272917 RepID=UPI001CC59984|nr:GNAT family N-acetyltransferase [Planococcus chinensis]MBZ5199748.1 GNAT family N-acetyltransferase [Planococcus chinensis]